ncbi:peptidoglycan-binding protein [Roseiflexus sp.]|uniref:peptidoglycan-binding domain-containing protein n=1 Tax=Roseiflexus sp. TaxID=2562120 RepID=UPI0025848692|nr:peptidoglycan-binding protein [Roseiflexus sp.]
MKKPLSARSSEPADGIATVWINQLRQGPAPPAIAEEAPVTPEQQRDGDRAFGHHFGDFRLHSSAETDLTPSSPLVAPLTAFHRITIQTQRSPQSSRPTLRQGSSHAEDITFLQERLNSDGATPALEVDGIFGPLTDAATREFQRRHGLIVDGIVGPQTWGALNALERAGIAGPEDVVSGTRPVTAEQHLEVEQALHPNAHTSGGSVTTPPMTGAGVGGEFEQHMIAALDTLINDRVNPENEMPASPDLMDPIREIADAAQQTVEDFYARYIVMASRTPTGSYHPGSFRIPLGDASTRPVSREYAADWVDYFMSEPSYEPSQVLTDHNVDTSRDRPDRAEYTRVRDLYVSNDTRFHNVRNVIRGWPAEAGTGTVFVQPREYQGLVGRWALFKTMMHEFLHLVTHPNYARAAAAVGGSARQALIEGFTDHFTLQVWHHVRDSLEANRALRQRVEGNLFQPDLDPAILEDPSTYSQEAPERIVAAVGEENARVAYFMGYADLLGLGAGTLSEAPLTGIATWEPTDSDTAEEYTVRAGGETVARIRERTNAATITELDGTEVVDDTQRFAAGHRLHIPGIRWHRAIAEDTRAQVAGQHGITLEQLERANGWTHRRGNTPIPAGTRVLIPRH